MPQENPQLWRLILVLTILIALFAIISAGVLIGGRNPESRRGFRGFKNILGCILFPPFLWYIGAINSIETMTKLKRIWLIELLAFVCAFLYIAYCMIVVSSPTMGEYMKYLALYSVTIFHFELFVIWVVRCLAR